MSSRNDLLVDIASEVQRQNDLWGNQYNVRDISDRGDGLMWPDEQQAKWLSELAVSRGTLSWTHILFEEMAEAIGAQDDNHRIRELIQVAAVCVSWADAIQNRNTFPQTGAAE